jgi:hypothetical protein
MNTVFIEAQAVKVNELKSHLQTINNRPLKQTVLNFEGVSGEATPPKEIITKQPVVAEIQKVIKKVLEAEIKFLEEGIVEHLQSVRGDYHD